VEKKEEVARRNSTFRVDRSVGGMGGLYTCSYRESVCRLAGSREIIFGIERSQGENASP
jgi:hypothetical protein